MTNSKWLARTLLVAIGLMAVVACGEATPTPSPTSSPTPSPTPDPLAGGILATFDVSGEQFKVWVTNEDTIEQILALQRGESNATIPNGPILRGPGTADHNAPFGWHLHPELTEMAEITIEVCDGRPSYVEENISEFVDNVGRYCPWSAELVNIEDHRQGA